MLVCLKMFPTLTEERLEMNSTIDLIVAAGLPMSMQCKRSYNPVLPMTV